MVECRACGGDLLKPLFSCAVHAVTLNLRVANRRTPPFDHYPSCLTCRQYEPHPDPPHIVIDPAKLWAGRCFNCGLIVHQGRRLLVYRKEWSNARCIIAELGDDWQPVANTPIVFRGQAGQEDPRLFHYRGRLHMSYTAYDGSITSVGYVRLRDDLSVEASYLPTLTPRNEWEKNWTFFEHDDGLYAVYWAAPHVVIRVNEARAERAYESAWVPPWTWGEMRGGCSPVRVGDEFYHFFHARLPADSGTYSVGLYTFEAQPPFRPLRMIRRPLALARREQRPEPDIATVVFPGGAVLDGAMWRIAAGWMDSQCRIYSWPAEQIEAELRPV